MIAQEADAPTLFPPAAFGTSLTAENVWSQLYWPLIRDVGFGGSYRPGLADSIRFSDDSLHVDYFLNPTFAWHDGQPVRAEDAIFGIRVWTSAEASLMPNRLHMLESAEALDSLTVRVTLDRRYPAHTALEPGILALPLPKHILKDVPLADLKNHPIARRPVGNGPFRFLSWEPSHEIAVEANPDFPRGRPFLNRIVFRVVPDQTSRATQIMTGQVDVLDGFPPALHDRLASDPDLRVHTAPSAKTTFITWNLADPRFGERAVRQALSLAVDRQALVDALLFGLGQPGSQPIPRGSVHHDTTLAPYPHAPERARALLDSSGWIDRDGDGIREKNGQRLDFPMLAAARTESSDLLTMLQEQFRRVGVALRPRMVEATTATDLAARGEFAAFLTVVDHMPSPYPHAVRYIYETDAVGNFGGIAEPALDSLLREADEAAPARAQQLWDTIQRMIAEEAYHTFLYEPDYLVALDRRFQGAEIRSVLWLVDWENGPAHWWVRPEHRRYNVPLGGR